MVKDFKGSAGKPNQLPRTNASSKLGKGRRKDKDGGSQRSAETIARLKMYTNGKAIRNKKGDVVAGTFMMNDRAGDRTITAETGRIQPDRRWFGNTRTVTSNDLDTFRQQMTEAVSDPYSIVLKRKKLPMGLLQDVAEYTQGKAKRSALLEQEPFEHAFGSKTRRKRVKLDQLLIGRTMENNASTNRGIKMSSNSGQTETINSPHVNTEANHEDDDDNNVKGIDDRKGYEMLLQSAKVSQSTYEQINVQDGIVPWGRDHNITRSDGEGFDWRHEKKDDLFLKGQSKRIWGEFFKVIDCSDVGTLFIFIISGFVSPLPFASFLTKINDLPSFLFACL
jgi:nuclear GTP-binding protein